MAAPSFLSASAKTICWAERRAADAKAADEKAAETARQLWAQMQIRGTEVEVPVLPADSCLMVLEFVADALEASTRTTPR